MVLLQVEIGWMDKWWVFIVFQYLGGGGGHDAVSEAVGDLAGELVLSVYPTSLLMPVHPVQVPACWNPLLSLH